MWELVDAGSTTFPKLLAKEKNLYSLFAHHMGGTCPFINQLLVIMLNRAKDSSKRISILGFIYRLGEIYAKTTKVSQNDEYTDFLGLLLDYTLGNEVKLERLDILSRLGLTHSRTFGREVIGEFFLRGERLSDLKTNEIQSYFKLLVYTKAEIEFCQKFLREFLTFESLLGKGGMLVAKDPILRDVISEMSDQKSILKPFIVHPGEIAYERLILLISFYSENFRQTFKASSYKGGQLVRFLRIFQKHPTFPNLPISAINMLCSYYIRDIKASQKDAVDIVLKLSREERSSLKSLQPNFPFIIAGISDPSCTNHQEILESLLQIGITECNAPIYVLVKFSLTYILNPVTSLRTFIFDLEQEAETNSFIKEVLSYKIESNDKVMPFLEFLSKFESSHVFAALQNVHFDKESLVFDFFFKELVSIYYYPKLDLYDYFPYFESHDSFRRFLWDLWAAKHGNEPPFGFTEIFKFFGGGERYSLTHMIDYKKDFTKWLSLFRSSFQEYIIEILPGSVIG